MLYFPEIVGNAVALSLLSQYVATNTFPPSLLLRGPEGVGKLTVAQRVARLANCLGDRSPKCSCESCNRFNAHVSPYCICYPHAVNKGILRDLQVQLGTRVGSGYRFVVLRAEAMDLGTQDMFLKTLEEPVERTGFIITSSAALPKRPVVSRSVIINFTPCTQEEMGTFCMNTPFALTQFQSFGDEECGVLLALAGGSPGALMRLMGDSTIRTKLGLIKQFFAPEVHPEFFHQLSFSKPTDIAHMILTLAHTSLYAQGELGISKDMSVKVIRALEGVSGCPIKLRLNKLYTDLKA